MIEYGRKSWQVIEKIGGASRDRTDDLIVANDGVCQIISFACPHLAAEYGPLRSNSEPARLGVASNLGPKERDPSVAGPVRFL